LHWTKDNPFDVGNAASFQNGFTSLSLAPFFDKHAIKCCTNRAAAECAQWIKDNPSVSPGCFARLLTTDYQGPATAQDAATGSPAFTVEGWVQIQNPQGGVVMSTGKAAGRHTCTNKGSCQVALIYIEVNATHVTVGHEHALDDAGTKWKLNTVAFAVSSNAQLVAQLSDDGFYLNSNKDSTLVGKFVHVTVIRKSLVGPSHLEKTNNEREFWFSTYKVYINGYLSALAPHLHHPPTFSWAPAPPRLILVQRGVDRERGVVQTATLFGIGSDRNMCAQVHVGSGQVPLLCLGSGMQQWCSLRWLCLEGYSRNTGLLYAKYRSPRHEARQWVQGGADDRRVQPGARAS